MVSLFWKPPGVFAGSEILCGSSEKPLLCGSGFDFEAPRSSHGFELRLGSLRISKIELSLKREHDFQSAGDTPKIDNILQPLTMHSGYYLQHFTAFYPTQYSSLSSAVK